MFQTTGVSLLLLCLTALSAAEDYDFARVDVPGATSTIVNTINARGDIVGNFTDVDGTGHGFLLRQGVFSVIDFPGASFTAARSINARGDIAGRFSDANGNQHGYVLRDDHFTKIDYPGASATVVRGINNAGDISGNYLDSTGLEIGFIFQDGRFQKVQAAQSNACSTDVWMVQDNGRTAVGDLCKNSDSTLYGYLRRQPGSGFQLISFPNTGSFPCTSSRYINEKGDISGIYVIANSEDECYNSGSLRGFLLRQGKYIAIDVPGATDTAVTAVNDDGVIVGFYYDEQGVSHGFKGVRKDRSSMLVR
ncbi:MAG TPA: hypothetical protein VEI01_12040 [Terriglobales bacterium]|nr:hypothetical protein [Terriglobales bacterium]